MREDNSGKLPRRSGVLLHPTSLPGPFGIGDLGREAYRFADWLAGAGQKLWQMLPLGPTGYGNSPYQSPSAFAGNPLLISPEILIEDGLLRHEDMGTAPPFPSSVVDFDAAASYKNTLLAHSFEAFESSDSRAIRQRFDEFCENSRAWLDNFALFMALREAHGLAPWTTWEPDIRRREPAAVSEWRRSLQRHIRRHQYYQFLFFDQWLRLRGYCRQRGIQLVGDIPIFVSLDSDAVWTHPEQFYLDENGQPTVVAGVPPDYFSKTGQLWNNPLYRWDVMAQDGYSWWVQRFKAAREFFDIVRIDHFRGFEKYWEIPAGSRTAVEGRWVNGPGADFFEIVLGQIAGLAIIAEDLGMITPEVIQLRDRFGFPGMRVLQFAFGSGPDNPHLPHNYPRNCVVYTGTHDNDTTIGWFRNPGSTTLSQDALKQERQNVLDYIGSDGKEINWDLIRLAEMSVADTCIIPLQDILGLGSEARMNIPGTVGGNWAWRFTAGMLTDQIKERLGGMAGRYGR